MPQFGSVFIDPSLMPTAAPATTDARPTLGAIFKGAAEQAYGQVRYGLPAAIEKASGDLSDEDARFYAKGLSDYDQAASKAAPSSVGDLFAGKVGVGRFLAENLVAGVPMLAGGAAGAAAGTLVGGPVGGVLGGAAVIAPQFVGSNVDRAIQSSGGLSSQAAERSLLAAVPQALGEEALGHFIPGVGRVFGLGRVAGDAVGEQAGSFISRAATGIAKAGGTGAASMAGQEFGARYAAGEDLTGTDAVKAYVSSAATGLAIGGAFGAAHSAFGAFSRSPAVVKDPSQVTTDDANKAVDAALNPPQLPGPAPVLALPAPGEGVQVPAGNDLRRADFQVDPRGNVAPATPDGSAALAGTPVGDLAIDAQGNAIVRPTTADLFARIPQSLDSAPAAPDIDAFTARFGRQDTPGLPLEGGRAAEVQRGLPFASPLDTAETPASRLPQLPLDRALSEEAPDTQLTLGERRVDDVTDPNTRTFQNETISKLHAALTDKRASAEVKAEAAREIADRTAEATGATPVEPDVFQKRLADLKEGLRSQFVQKLTADNPQELVGKVYDEVFENQNTQANVTKLAQRMGLLDDKLQPTDLAGQVEAQRAEAQAADTQAQAAQAEQPQPTPVGAAPDEPAPAPVAEDQTAAPAAPTEAVSAAPQTVDPAFADEWAQLKQAAGITRERSLDPSLKDVPPNRQAAEASVFRALAEDKSDAQVSQTEKMAQQMGLVTKDDSMDVTPKGRQAYLATPEGREDIAGAAREQGYTDAQATTFDRGVQSLLSGADTATHTSFEDMAAYQAGKVWAQDFVEKSGTKTLDQTRVIQERQAKRANGRAVDRKAGERASGDPLTSREVEERRQLTPGEVRKRALHQLLDASDFRGVRDTDVAGMRKMVENGASPEELGRVLAETQGGKVLFAPREVAEKPTRGQPIFKEMNTPDRVTGVKAGSRVETEAALRIFRAREVIKEAVLSKEITAARGDKLHDLLDEGKIDQVGKLIRDLDANSIGAYMREGGENTSDIDRILGRRTSDRVTYYPPDVGSGLHPDDAGRVMPKQGLAAGRGMDEREEARYRKAYWRGKDASAAARDRLLGNQMSSGASDLAFEQSIAGKSFHEAAQEMVDHAPSPQLGAVMKGIQGLASKLENLGQKFEMNVVHLGDDAPAALSEEGTRAFAQHTVEPPVSAVYLKSAELGPAAGTNYQVAAHEMLHAVTMRALNFGLRRDQANTNLGRAARDLRSLGQAVVDHLNARAEGGLDKLSPIERDIYTRRSNALADHNEVLAWGMTNPDFQRYLQSIEYAPRQSVFGKLVDVVRSMLGLDPKAGTALTELMRVSEQVMGLSERDLAPAFGRDDPAFGETGTVQAHLSEGGASAANRTVGAANSAAQTVVDTVSKAAERIKAGDLQGAARRTLMGWRSENSLLRDYEHVLPEARARYEAKSRHDGIRGALSQLSAQPVQDYQAYKAANPKMERELNRLMYTTTQFKLDPAKAFDAHTHLTDAERGNLRSVYDWAVKTKNDLSRGDGAGWKLFQDFRAYNEMENHAHFAMDLHNLVASDDEYRAGVVGSDVNPMDAFTRHEGIKSSDEGRTYWQGALDAQIKAAQAYVDKKKGEAAKGSATDIRNMNQHLAPIEVQIATTKTALDGMARSPYFHLGRFGDFFASATIRKLDSGTVDPAAQRHVADAIAKAGFDNVHIGTDTTVPKMSARFDSKGQVEQFKALLLDLHKGGYLDGGIDDIKAGPRESQANTGVLRALPAQLAAAIAHLEANPMFVPDDNATPQVRQGLEKQKQEAIQAVKDAYLEQQPDSAVAKVLTRRYEVPGYNPDMLRNFAHRAGVGANSLANKGTSAALGTAWKQMRAALTESRSAGNTRDPYTISDLVTEYQKRDAVQPVSPTQGNFVNKLNAIAHPYYLGLSPSYAMVTQAQIGMNALPELAKVHGYGSSFHALRRAYPAALSLMKSVMAEAAKGGAGHYVDVALTEAAIQGSKLSPAQKDFTRRMVAAGSLDVGQVANAMNQIAKKGGQTSVEVATKYASAMALHAETYSRLIVALAAHELHGGEDLDARTAYAKHVVSESMFDFQSWNRARLLGKQGFLGPLTPLVTQFMTFSAQMTEKLYSEVISATGKARPGETAEAAAERARQARVFLAGHLVATTALAGTLGLPFASVFAAAASKIGNAARGPNDEPFDAVTSYRNFLANVLGKDVAEVVAHGAPRALGADFSGRVGEGDLLPFSKMLGDKRSWRESVQNALGRSGGASLTMLENFADAGHKFGEGDLMGGMIAGLPTSLRNPAKAYQMSTEGYVDSKGRVLPMTPDARDIMYQLLGFTPSDKAEYQEARGAQSDRRLELSQRAGSLRTQIVRALSTGDSDKARSLVADAQEFDRSNPAFAVIPSLAGAVERQAQARIQSRALGTPMGVPIQDIAGQHLTRYANF